MSELTPLERNTLLNLINDEVWKLKDKIDKTTVELNAMLSRRTELGDIYEKVRSK